MRNVLFHTELGVFPSVNVGLAMLNICYLTVPVCSESP